MNKFMKHLPSVFSLDDHIIYLDENFLEFWQKKVQKDKCSSHFIHVYLCLYKNFLLLLLLLFLCIWQTHSHWSGCFFRFFFTHDCFGCFCFFFIRFIFQQVPANVDNDDNDDIIDDKGRLNFSLDNERLENEWNKLINIWEISIFLMQISTVNETFQTISLELQF